MSTYNPEKYEDAKYNLSVLKAKENEKKLEKINEKRTEQLEKRNLKKAKKEVFDKSSLGVTTKNITRAAEKVVSGVGRFMSKAITKRIKAKRVLRHKTLVVNMGNPNYRAPSVLGDENRFFTGHYQQEKRSMFFS